MEQIKIVIADDHQIFREGFKLLLKPIKEIVIVGEAENGRQLFEVVRLQQPDIVFTDLQMPDINGVAACRRIKKSFPDIHVIALTTYNDDHFIVDILEAGASGYILKNTNKSELKQAIETVRNGEMYYSSATSKKLARMVAESKFNPNRLRASAHFTERELVIMKLICEEFTNKEIAAKLNLSMRTVESHREKIQEKTGSKNTAGIVVYCIRHCLFEI